jgi:hypothetical protein
MINVNGTDTLAFGIKSQHQLVRKGSFVNQKVARKPSSISLMFAGNIDPNSIDDSVNNNGLTSPSGTADGANAISTDVDDMNAPDRPDFDAEEKIAFSEHLNNVLKEDKMLSRYFPLDPYSDDLYTRLDDGVILCKVVLVCRYDFEAARSSYDHLLCTAYQFRRSRNRRRESHQQEGKPQHLSKNRKCEPSSWRRCKYWLPSC